MPIFINRMFWVVLILIGLYFFLKSIFAKKTEKRTFTSPSFSKIRKEVNKGELVQDPVSRSFIAKEEAIHARIGGKDYYFVSKENLEKFRADN